MRKFLVVIMIVAGLFAITACRGETVEPELTIYAEDIDEPEVTTDVEDIDEPAEPENEDGDEDGDEIDSEYALTTNEDEISDNDESNEELDEESNYAAQATTEAGEVRDIRQGENVWVEINGVRLHPGMTVADINATIFEVFDLDIEDRTLAANSVTSISFAYGAAAPRVMLNVGIVNPTNAEIPIADAIVRVITLDHMGMRPADTVYFMGDIQINVTTEADIIALLGEPDDRLDGVATTIWYNSPDYRGAWTGTSVQFSFGNATERRLSSIRMQSFYD